MVPGLRPDDPDRLLAGANAALSIAADSGSFVARGGLETDLLASFSAAVAPGARPLLLTRIENAIAQRRARGDDDRKTELLAQVAQQLSTLPLPGRAQSIA